MPITPATKTVQDVVNAVQRSFGDESGAQITEEDIIRWLNEAQLEIARTNKWNKSTATTPSVADQAEYSFAGTNIISIESVSYAGVPLTQISFRDAQENIFKFVGEDDAGGTPSVWYDWGEAINLYPAPEASGESIKLFCILYPENVTNVTDSLSIPDVYFQALLDYILSKAYELDDDWGAHSFKKESSASALAGMESDLGSEQYYPIITVLPEDA